MRSTRQQLGVGCGGVSGGRQVGCAGGRLSARPVTAAVPQVRRQWDGWGNPATTLRCMGGGIACSSGSPQLRGVRIWQWHWSGKLEGLAKRLQRGGGGGGVRCGGRRGLQHEVRCRCSNVRHPSLLDHCCLSGAGSDLTGWAWACHWTRDHLEWDAAGCNTKEHYKSTPDVLRLRLKDAKCQPRDEQVCKLAIAPDTAIITIVVVVVIVIVITPSSSVSSPPSPSSLLPSPSSFSFSS
eukprot:647430-Pelagomonas_calceolata.AAC.1